MKCLESKKKELETDLVFNITILSMMASSWVIPTMLVADTL